MRLVLGGVACFGVLALAATLTAQQPARAKAAPVAKAPSSSAPAVTADEQAIRAAATAFAKAYNEHNPKAIAELFVPQGELIDPSGAVQQGRPAIAEVFAAVFAESPEAKMEIKIDAIRFLTPTLAIEDGVALVTRQPNGAAEPNRYTATHVKQDGKWQMASARDVPEVNASEALAPLGWLIGEWIDESPDSLVRTTYEWSENKAYILSKFEIHIGGKPVMTGTQRIGWDPLEKVIRSWLFDSEGGFGNGIYAQNGDSWTVKVTSVTRDGEAATATNMLRKLSNHRLEWISRDRTLAGEAVPDIGPITVVRKPPVAE